MLVYGLKSQAIKLYLITTTVSQSQAAVIRNNI